jgi:phosphopantetheine--protein transferase-like protein
VRIVKLKVGIDIAYIPKIKELMQDESFIKKTFHLSECKKYTADHLAGVFAAKEAFFKAIDRKYQWLKVEIVSSVTGKPEIILPNGFKEYIITADLSISHNGDYAIAAAIVLANDEK